MGQEAGKFAAEQLDEPGRITEITGPDAGGHLWKPGQSGNPAGRPKGSRNRATVIAEQLLQADAERLTRTAIDLALGGDRTCLRLCLERLLPPVKERPLTLEGSDEEASQRLSDRVQSVWNAVLQGRITPREGSALAGLLESYRKAREMDDLQARVETLEARTRQRAA